jgi:hypothetical protein
VSTTRRDVSEFLLLAADRLEPSGPYYSIGSDGPRLLYRVLKYLCK